MTHSLQNQLDQIISGLKENYKPEFVILFGSLAHGSFTEDSDVDMMIVKDTKRKPIWRRVDARKSFVTDLPVDIIVYTPQEFKLLKNDAHSFVNQILSEGKVLYEKKH
jgi:predicted nucleotidyltransferase